MCREGREVVANGERRTTTPASERLPQYECARIHTPMIATTAQAINVTQITAPKPPPPSSFPAPAIIRTTTPMAVKSTPRWSSGSESNVSRFSRYSCRAAPAIDARKPMASAASTASATPPPPGTNATGTARIRMIATFLMVRSTALILLPRHHDDPDRHRRQRGQESHQTHDAEGDRGRGTAVAAHIRESRGAEDREREDQRHAHAGNEGRDNRLQERLGVDDRRQHRLLRGRDRGPRPDSAREGGHHQRERGSGHDDRAGRSRPEDPGHAVGERPDARRGGQRDEPGGHDVPGDAPADGRDPFTGARAHDTPADHLRGGQRKPEMRGGEDHGRSRARR